MNRKHWVGLVMIVAMLATLLPAMTVSANPPSPDGVVVTQPPADEVAGPPSPLVGVASQKSIPAAQRAAISAQKSIDQPNPIDYQRIRERQRLLKEGKTAQAAALSEGPDDRILVIMVEFAGTDTFTWKPGDTWDPYGIADPNEAVYDASGNLIVGDCSNIITEEKTFTYSGPLHNEIPRPLSAEDRSGDSIWTEDFSPDWFHAFMFGDGVKFEYTRQDGSVVSEDFTGQSVKDYFLDMSGGDYEITGDIVGWLQLPHSTWYYGADKCPGNRSGMSSGAGADGGIPDAGGNRVLVRHALDAVNAKYPDFDWTQYDLNGDKIIDRLWIVHAGYGEEDGTVLLNRTDYGESANWSHSSAVTPPYPVGDGISAGPYIMMPENGGIGVFAHEYAHNLGAWDLYAYGEGNTSTGFWALQSDDWTGYPIGYEPPAVDPMHLDWWGWLNPMTINDPSQVYEFKLGQASDFPGGEGVYRGAKIELPDGEAPLAVSPWQGEYYWWGGKADLANGMMTSVTPVAIPAGGATLSFDLVYDIEEYWDFLWVQVSEDGTTWTTLTNAHTQCDHDPDWIGELYGFPADLCAAGLGGLTGYNANWPDPELQEFDLAAFAGKSVFLRLWYMTDWATTYSGPFVDNVKVAAGGNVLFEDDAEGGDANWTYAEPWQRSNGTQTFVHNFYLQWRNVGENGGYDSALGDARWRFGPANTGLLVWYNNTFYSDNEIFNYLTDFPGWGPKGNTLVVDSHPEPYRYPDLVAAGYNNEFGNLTSRGLMRDAPFTLKDTVDFMNKDPYGWANVPEPKWVEYEGRPAESQFHDSLGYYPGAEFVPGSPVGAQVNPRWMTVQWDASTVVPAKEFYGVKAPGYNGTAVFRFSCSSLNALGQVLCYGYGLGLGYPGSDGNPGSIDAQYGWHVALVDEAMDGTWGKVVVWNSPVLTTLEKKVNREKAYAGNILMYQLKVRNMSPVPQEFSVSDPLPAGTTYLRGSDYDAATNTVEWSGTVQPYGVKVTHVWVRVNAGVEPGTEIVNAATLTDDALGGSASVTTKVMQSPPKKGQRADVGRPSDLVVRGN
jgi:immune inhibitor A